MTTATAVVRGAPGRAAAAARRVEALRPRHVLGVLVLGQWLAVLAFSLVVRHNEWLYYQGGDQLWSYTSGWLLSHGILPPTLVGYGWAFLLTPIAFFAGPNLASALPAVLIVDGLVLLPVALLCVYGIGRRVGGRLFGYWCAALWIAVPFVGVRYANAGYHQKYTELFLPQSLGLTAMADFPATVALLVSALFCLRALDSHEWPNGLASGLAAGFAIGIKPSTAIFLPALGVALLAGRRLRPLPPIALGLIPALATLALWKERGLGNLPLLRAEPTVRLALGATANLVPANHYIHLNWSHLNDNLLGIQEHFWSLRLIEWLPVAGAIGLARRSLPLAGLAVTWFGIFVVAKGSYAQASVEDGSLLRVMLPSAPAFLLLIAAIPLLVPGLPRRLRARAVPGPTGRRTLSALGVAFVVVGIAPLVLVATASPMRGNARAVEWNGMLVPVSPKLRLQATRAGNSVELRWQAQGSVGSKLFYRVVRGSPDEPCVHSAGSADRCSSLLEPIGVTRSTSFVDPSPGKGHWTYRVGVAANWLDDTSYGDIFALGPPVQVVVP